MRMTYVIIAVLVKHRSLLPLSVWIKTTPLLEEEKEKSAKHTSAIGGDRNPELNSTTHYLFFFATRAE
jgi:hypothetical protein